MSPSSEYVSPHDPRDPARMLEMPVDIAAEHTELSRERLRISRVPSPATLLFCLTPFLLTIPITSIASHATAQLALIDSIELFGGEVCVEPAGPAWVWRHLGVRGRLGLGRVCTIKAMIRPSNEQMVQIGCLQSLRELHLEFTATNDDDLRHLAGLENLLVLDLDATKVTDKGLLHLRGLRRLQWLSLDSTRITDDGLSSLSGMTELQSLYLDSTKVTDAGLPALRGLTRLTVMGLRATRVTDSGMKDLSGLSRLLVLDLYATKVSKDGIRELQAVNCINLTAPAHSVHFPLLQSDILTNSSTFAAESRQQELRETDEQAMTIRY